MMLQRSSPDDGAAAVARLTAKERECLDRWLGHATAKEIALELGITHHAVEKRLKSARTKLGVASTLDAARLLAAAEGYGRAVSQSPEVGATEQEAQEDPTTAPTPWWKQRRGQVITGASLMSIIILAAFAAFGQPAATTAPQASAPRMPEVIMVNRKSGQPNDLPSGLGQVFDRLDKDRNDLLEGSEMTNAHFRVVQASSAQAAAGAAGTSPIAGFDGNKDGRVSRREFVAGMTELTGKRR